MGAAVVACEGCQVFRVAEKQTAIQAALLAFGAVSIGLAGWMLVRAWRRRGRRRLGALLMAAGILAVPAALAPLTSTLVLYDLPFVTTPSGVRVRAATFAVCGQPMFASFSLRGEMPTDEGRVAQQACRDAVAGSQRTSELLLLAAVGLVVAGAVVGRSPRQGSREASAVARAVAGT